MSKTLLVPVEIYTRSFSSRLRIAFHFVALGGTSIIGSQDQIKRIMQDAPGRFNYLSKGEPQTQQAFNLLSSLQGKGAKLFLLDEEGGVVDSKGEILKFRYDQKVIEHYDRIYLWGENSVEFVEKVTSNFIVSGNPRFDKLFTDFTFVSPKFEISEFLNKYRFKVLINTSFGSGNNVKSHEELLNFVSQLKGKYFDEEDYELHIAHQKLIFLYVKKLTRLIAAKFKNIGIIIRPHPSENPLGYSDLIQQHPNIYLDKDRKLNAG